MLSGVASPGCGRSVLKGNDIEIGRHDEVMFCISVVDFVKSDSFMKLFLHINVDLFRCCYIERRLSHFWQFV